MASFASVNCRHQPLQLSLNRHRPHCSNATSSLSFRTRPIPSPSKSSSIRASSSPLKQTPSPPKCSIFESLKPLLKTTCFGVAAATLFFSRLQHKPAIACPTTTVAPVVEPSANESADSDSHLGEQERAVEQNLTQLPNDVEGLQSLMEEKVKARKFGEAIVVIDRLIELEPKDPEWPMLKAQIFSYSEDYDSAKAAFEGILAKDPLSVEAYHGLVIAYSESGVEMSGLEKRIEEAMKQCKKEKETEKLRDFKLLMAQLRVMEGKSSEALKVYQGLVKEEPKDFRPYLCMGIIYSLLEENDEAEKQFDKFRRLIPENHPYLEYFADNVIASKLFPDKVRRQSAGTI